MHPSITTRIWLSVPLAMSGLVAAFAAQSTDSKNTPPKLILFEEKARDAGRKKGHMDEAAQTYAEAKSHARAANGIESQATLAERAAAQRDLDAAVQNVTKATTDWAAAENQRRKLEGELQTQDLMTPPADPAGQSNPLGPSHPIHHDIHGGPIFEYLRDRVAPDSQVDPTNAGRIHFDGDRGRGMPPVIMLGEWKMPARQLFARPNNSALKPSSGGSPRKPQPGLSANAKPERPSNARSRRPESRRMNNSEKSPLTSRDLKRRSTSTLKTPPTSTPTIPMPYSVITTAPTISSANTKNGLAKI